MVSSSTFADIESVKKICVKNKSYKLMRFDEYNIKRKCLFRKLKYVAEYVNLELGFANDRMEINDHVIYIMLLESEKKVVGYLEALPIFKSFKILKYEDDVITLHPQSISNTKIGISKLWTAMEHRQIGIARSMLDECRASFFKNSNTSVSQFEIAFSSINDNFIYFLQKYYNGNLNDILIYLLEHN